MPAVNGKGPRAVPQQAQPQQAPIIEEIKYPIFGFQVARANDGSHRALIMDLPNGKRMIFPFSDEAAKQCGGQLMAPGVHVAR